jgi:hypothetical protein
MYDQILIPTDGSEGTRGAVEHAIDLATTYNAALHTIYVVDTNVGIDTSVAGTLDALEEAGENVIDGVIQQAEAAGVETIESVVAQGTPHQAILDYVDEHDIDLVAWSPLVRGEGLELPKSSKSPMINGRTSCARRKACNSCQPSLCLPIGLAGLGVSDGIARRI